MAKYKFECGGTLLEDAFVPLPAISIYRVWGEYGINFLWLVFAFSIRILSLKKYAFLIGDYTSKNAVTITEIKTEKKNDKKEPEA